MYMYSEWTLVMISRLYTTITEEEIKTETELTVTDKGSAAQSTENERTVC